MLRGGQNSNEIALFDPVLENGRCVALKFARMNDDHPRHHKNDLTEMI